jgi:hypothetical protein
MYPWLVWIINILLAGSIANAIYHDGEHKSIPLRSIFLRNMARFPGSGSTEIMRARGER